MVLVLCSNAAYETQSSKQASLVSSTRQQTAMENESKDTPDNECDTTSLNKERTAWKDDQKKLQLCKGQ